MKVKLVGPKEITMAFTTDAGVRHTAQNGEVTPDIELADVPSNLWGLGFCVNSGSESSPIPGPTKSRKPLDLGD